MSSICCWELDGIQPFPFALAWPAGNLMLLLLNMKLGIFLQKLRRSLIFLEKFPHYKNCKENNINTTEMGDFGMRIERIPLYLISP